MNFNEINSPTQLKVILANVDIAGFDKTFRHKRSDQDMFQMLGLFYEFVGEKVQKGDGKVVKFLGDAALIIFPPESPEKALHALENMQHEVKDIWAGHNLTCDVRVDIHIGDIICGEIGAKDEKRFDIIGEAVNDLFLMPHPDKLNLSDEFKKAIDA